MGNFIDGLALARWRDSILNLYTSADSLGLIQFQDLYLFHTSALPELLSLTESAWSMKFCHLKLVNSMPGVFGSSNYFEIYMKYYSIKYELQFPKQLLKGPGYNLEVWES